MLTRRVNLKLTYNGADISHDIAASAISLSYDDHAGGKADELEVQLEDRKGLWSGGWFPERGATLDATLQLTTSSTTEELPMGLFEIDEVEVGGPPSTVHIRAISVPASSSLRGEDKTRAWEKAKLSAIVADVAGGADMQVMYDTEDDPLYDRIEQSEQTDLSFLQKLCSDAGLSLKVTGDTIVVFDDAKFETLEPVLTITKEVVMQYRGRAKTNEIYKACKVEYHESKTKEGISYTFDAPNAPPSGRVLRVNERVTTLAEAEKLAKKRLRQKNKEEQTFTATIPGQTTLVAGVTVKVRGFGVFDGKYYVDKAAHRIGGGYTCALDLRKVLEGY